MNIHRSVLLVAALAQLTAVSLIAQSSKAPPPPPAVNRVRYSRPTHDALPLTGAKIEGSNVSRYTGYETLAEIKDTTWTGPWNEIKLDNTKLYRWVRVALPAGSKAKLGQLELYSGDRLLVAAGRGWIKAFVPGEDREDESVLIHDLFASATTNRPNFDPAELNLEQPAELKLTGPKDSKIFYTLDGSWPTAEKGQAYSQPIGIDKNTTVSAVAIQPDKAPSLVVTNTYLLKGLAKPGLVSAHIGNSLTGTTGSFWRYARTAGYDHKYTSFLRGGALTRELWALASGDYTSDERAALKEKQARERGSQTWDEFWGKIGKVDLITLQPRDFDLNKELVAEMSFIRKFREKSPDLQPWLYCEWVEMKRERPSDKGVVPSYQMPGTFPALTWEESMGAMLLYVEELQHRLNPQLKEGKPARIIPSALAMGWIKNMIDHGQFPGAKKGDFYPLLFNDQVHPAASPVNGSANGAYLVDMTWFSALYREAPEGRVLPIETTFTPEQARIIERLAWDVVKNYPDCGLYEEGKEPCGKPEFASDGKVITLKSSTPGAWFRYTLDGTTPTRTRGYVYCGAISVQPGIQVKAVAYKSGMADSEAAAQ